MTATHFTFKRPMSSFEIQQNLGRMPTKEERSAFSAWRNRNPNIDLNTNEPRLNYDEMSETELDRRGNAGDEIADKELGRRRLERSMPRSRHIKMELEELLPGRSERICELIEQLIEAKILND